MRIQLPMTAALFFLLSGCGTLRIDVDYGSSPVPAASETRPSGVETPGPTASGTSTASPTPSESAASSPSPTTSIPSPAEPDSAVGVAAGRDFTCEVMRSGRVRCWGNNTHGQLGNGTWVNSNIPVTVATIIDAKAVTAGWGHACALTASEGVKCWGYNADGELGDGSQTDQSRPAPVAGLGSGVIGIDAGDYHTCAVTASNQLKCWGKNTYGQLGDWTKESRNVPVVSPFFGGGVAEVAAGWGHTCVRTTEGWAKCWGNNAYGQMGFGKLTDIHLPAEDVINLNGRVIQVTAEGYQTCALTAGGGTQCWGDNRYGQLGDGADQKRYEPVQVTGLTAGVSRIETGWNHACAVISGGELQCWGWNFFGQLGDGTTLNRSVPIRVQYLTDGVEDIAVGWGHTCVVTQLGAVKCWGLNGSGQLGDGTWTDSKVPLTALEPKETPALAPTPIPTPTQTAAEPTAAETGASSGLPAFTALAAGAAHTCGVTSTGAVNCWGHNGNGQLGDGTTTGIKKNPAEVVGLPETAVSLAAGYWHTCAVTEKGNVFCWGWNYYGQLGDGTRVDRHVPVRVAGLPPGIRAVAAGYAHTCALTSEGEVICWGRNSRGALGDGTKADRSTPMRVIGLSGMVMSAVTAGCLHTCALTADGAVKCWGDNEFGELGAGTEMGEITTPVDAVGLSGWVSAISAGGLRTCAIDANGGLKCWGENARADGIEADSRAPVDIFRLSGAVTGVGIGQRHICALISGSSVQCWGSNLFGGLGNGSHDDSFVPVNVLGLTGVWKAISAGGNHTCVVGTDGRVMCWGWNEFGQLGDGWLIDRYTPVALAAAAYIPTATSAARLMWSNTCKFPLTATSTVEID